MKLTAHVDQLIARDVRRPVSWYDKLGDAERKELGDIKTRFRQGQYGKTSKRSLARAIVTAARERGLHICGENGVREWLSKD